MLVYNLFPLLAGKLPKWTPHLERAKAMGFDWVFVNPIHKTGQSGSLYSIADYYGYNPRILDPESTLKPEAQVKAMVEVAKGLGLKLMIDLVINHTAYDSPLVKQHPNWYKMENGRVAHPFAVEDDGSRTVWTDLAHLDYDGPQREKVYAYFEKLVDHLVDLGFDGFRCDAAYQVPRDVWQRLIEHGKKKYGDRICFAAETLGCPPDQTRETAEAGFDYVFNSAKWWDFESPWLLEQYNLVRHTCPSIAFPESRDTARLAEEMHGSVDALKQRYLFSALFSGGVMLPMGYEYGFKKKLHVVFTEPHHWEETDVDLTKFVTQVNAVKRDNPVFLEDAPTHLMHQHGNGSVMVMWKGSTKTRQEALIIMNRDAWNRQEFKVASLRNLVQSGGALKCVSPDNPMEHLHQPFHYELRPGEAIVVVGER